MKLNLGCGNKKMLGFINIDSRQEVSPDLIDDVSSLQSFKSNSVNLIYACHVLEHFDRFEYKEVLKRWFDVLEPGGVLRISVPDIEKVFNHYSQFKDLNVLKGFLWGGQTYPQNYHYTGFDFKTISNDLLEIGFSNVRHYDWRNTEHSMIDDFSQAYLPHMDKENGMLMSLNIEAYK